MCSLGDDNFEEGPNKYMAPCEKLSLHDTLCKKCRSLQAQVVLRGKDAYCKDCFLTATVHKFKGYLGKHRFTNKDDKVLVWYKPGHPITALLHFLRTGLDLNAHKKLRFEPVILCIEDRVDLSTQKRKEILADIKSDVGNYKFPLYFASLTEYIKDTRKDQVLKDNLEDISINHGDGEFLRGATAKSNLSIEDDFKNVVERNLLLACAKYLGCKCIFTTELGIDLASQLLANVSMGRGDQLPLDVGLLDDRSSTTIARPLRMFEAKELVFYNLFNSLEPLNLPESKKASQQTVHSLLKKFVGGLQVNYPATITTIVKTGEKLSLDQENLQEQKCLLCQGPVRNPTEALSSQESTDFSHYVSTEKPDYTETGVRRFEQLFELFDQPKTHQHCFACRRILAITNKDFINKLDVQK